MVIRYHKVATESSLNLGPFVHPSLVGQDGITTKYKLRGLIRHYGSDSRWGHYYTAYIMGFDGVWRCYNDLFVGEHDPTAEVSDGDCLLLYVADRGSGEQPRNPIFCCPRRKFWSTALPSG
jgi:hypothetical protein